MAVSLLKLMISASAISGAIQGAGAAERTPVRVAISNPSVRLWYEGSGRLSANIAPPRSFALWNTIIGEGEAEENANDALFTVELRTNGQQNLVQPVVMKAIDAKGKVLASRTFDGLLTDREGRVVPALWVRDVGCAGHIVFSAQVGKSRQTVALDFDCGE